ncbi:Nickel/cobalt efflux system RcnA [Halomicronema hongdechloris C2206]|uniref:Nickel/cobalt efflux system n=1 Tax=Halomicronema hongdechloris C2206 TaxID=1641165 RepID=A0A1Z3HNQ6_9CYAN|nr:sulfite exporter TauE/SafE family protein [Halomicronema hongdechloris]ASC71915.1 Nickel/cobalt efflux system RcnA [Halomicronema hongdechloris C2206]
MLPKRHRYSLLSLLAGMIAIGLSLVTTSPSLAHWDDLAAAKLVVGDTEVQMTLTYPTRLTAFADDDGNGQLAVAEIDRHQTALQAFLGDRIALKDGLNRLGSLQVQSGEAFASPMLSAAPDSHSTLQLTYRWPDAMQGLVMNYTLFVPNAPEASCLATLVQGNELTTHVFTPQQPTFALMPGGLRFGAGTWLLPLIGAFVWGAVHSLSPGHGKTLIGAYLVGERATPLHAIFLAMTTTVTHTLGVIALGLVTLLAARYILPEQLYPWLSLISGSLVIAIGLNLLWQRRRRTTAVISGQVHSHGHDHAHAPHAQTHPHDPGHVHHHCHDAGGDRHHHPSHSHAHHPADHVHTHSRHTHSHLPLTTDSTPVTWRNLLMLGFSGGLVPCPAALVLLLGAIALGNTLSGLVLVLAFSLGLASVLTGLGLLLVYARQVFQRIPTPRLPLMQWLPAISALGITVIGIGISTRSILQIF